MSDTDLVVHRSYCPEHVAIHYVDENEKCWGKDLVEVQKRGFTYARHIGGGWFGLRCKYTSKQDLAWEMAAEAHDSALLPYQEPDLFDF